MKLGKKEFSKAIQVYAKKHGWYASTVRTCTRLMLAAVAEYQAKS